MPRGSTRRGLVIGGPLRRPEPPPEEEDRRTRYLLDRCALLSEEKEAAEAAAKSSRERAFRLVKEKMEVEEELEKHQCVLLTSM